MHEMSVAVEVCRIAEHRLGSAEAHRLRTVVLDLGTGSGLEPANLEFCLEALLGQPPFGAARPRLVPVAGDDVRIDYLEVELDDPDD